MIIRSTIILSLFALLLVGCHADAPDRAPPFVDQGVLDLSGWDFKRDGNVKLDGDWEFYWRQLLPVSGKGDVSDDNNSAYIRVPGVWNRSQEKLPETPAHGYATYRMRILMTDLNKPLALKIPQMSTAYELFLNGRKISSNGQVGRDSDSSKPEFRTRIFEFSPGQKRLELTVHVSNFHYSTGGIWRSFTLGERSEIRGMNLKKLAFDILFFGGILIVGFYNLGIFFYRRKEKAPFYFGLFCLLVSLRIVVTDEIYITYLFPGLPWQLLVRSELLTFYLGVPVFFLYLFNLYPKEFIKGTFRFIQAFGLLFSAFALFASTSFSTSALRTFQLFLVVCLFYIMFILIRAAYRKREGAVLFLAGFVTMFAAAVNDVLFVNFIINTGFFLQYAFFIFVLLQVLLLISLTSNAFSKVESLSEKLTEYNITLEQKVRQRTHELNLSLEAVESSSKKILSSIEYAKRIQDSLLPSVSEARQFFPDSFFLWKPRDIVGGDFFYVKHIEDKIVIAAVDCTGHGVPGAFMTMIAASSMGRIIVDDRCLDPAEILSHLNSAIQTALQQEKPHATSNDGLDAAICIVEKEAQKLTFAGARLPLVIIDNGQVSYLKGDRRSIGYRNADLNFRFTNHEIALSNGKRFYLYTDGIIDQLGGEKRFSFGKNRLKKLLLEIQNESFDRQEEAIYKAFEAYKGELEAQDDITVIGFRVDMPA